MQLQRLTEGNLEYLKGKKVYCIGSTESYIREFCDTYQVRDNIVCVGDRNVRNRSVICVDGIGIPIEDVACLKGEDLSEKVLVITDDYYQEKYQLITEVMCAKQPNMTIYYFANKETEYELKYREQYKDITVENIIIFRSGPHASAYVKGMDFADNARALFEYMLENGYNEKYELVWFVKNPEEFEQYNNVINVKFMSFDWSVSENEEERNSYYHALCLAKYIFSRMHMDLQGTVAKTRHAYSSGTDVVLRQGSTLFVVRSGMNILPLLVTCIPKFIRTFTDCGKIRYL